MISSTQETAATFTSVDNSLIQYIEIWTPGDDGSRLVLESAQSVGRVSKRRKVDVTSVAIGEGLVGEAWKNKAAVICHDESLCSLLDSEEPGLTGIVVIPVFRQQEIRGVVVLGLGDGFGAAEIWTRDDRDELSVTSGHYAGLPSFEFITAYTRFPKGAGVPGNVWKTGLPILAQELDKSSAFIRSFGNDPAVITSAIGLPICSSHGFPRSVLLTLEAADCPLAALTELWICGETDAPDSTSTVIQTCTAVGRACSSDSQWKQKLMARISECESPVFAQPDDGCLPDGASCVIAMPVFNNSGIVGVLALGF